MTENALKETEIAKDRALVAEKEANQRLLEGNKLQKQLSHYESVVQKLRSELAVSEFYLRLCCSEFISTVGFTHESKGRSNV